jgi:SAM-dependent methyltransferase
MGNYAMNVFNLYSKYYDLLYEDKDYSGESVYIQNLLNEFGHEASSILEFGSGTGKHGRLLGECGYQVTGVELSKEMVSAAKSDDNFTCIQGDMTTINLNKTFDCVLSLFHVVSYLTKNSQITEFFINSNRHLKSGGLLIFDIWYSPCVNLNTPGVRVKRMKDSNIELIRIAEPDIYKELNIVDVVYSIFYRYANQLSWSQINEVHSMRHFSMPEVENFANQNGFELIRAEEFKTKNLPSVNTWGVCFIMRKVN